LARQLAKATAASGAVEIEVLSRLVDAAYEQTDRDRRRTDRSIAPELAEEAVRRRPGLKVLFTAGYTENAILSDGCLPSGVLLLAKPYRKTALADMVRQAVNSDMAPHAA
jgi:hypothetical protein